MIVENPSGSLPQAGVAPRFRNWLRSREVRRNAILFCCFSGIVLSLQVLSGAYHSEFAGYPDEPAHYVTALMVRDFIAQLHWFSPLQFAENYYAHYPKVAFGHWPPLLYVVQALWMLIFSASRASILVEMAVLTSFLAFSVYLLARRLFNWQIGAALALLLICLPEIQRYTDEVMAETLLILVSFQAAVFFARYLETERWQDNLWFGVFTTMAVLTKGNGWELGFVPPIALVLTRKWRLVQRASFWLPAALVLILCVPWQVWSFPMAHRGWTGGDQPNAAYTLAAMGTFVQILGSFMGPVLTVLAIAGIFVTVLLPAFRDRVQPIWAVLLGLIFGVWAFHVLVPAGIESRKMIVAVPALILFLAAGWKWLESLLPATRWRAAAIPAVLAVCFAVQTFFIPRETRYGFTEAARFIDGEKDGRDQTVLVSSEGDGEGLLISEVAMHDAHRPAHTVLRGSRALSTSDWTGSAYQCPLHSVADLESALRRDGVGLVVIDTYPSMLRFTHHRLILKAIQEDPASWHLVGSFHGGPHTAGQVLTYRFAPKV